MTVTGLPRDARKRSKSANDRTTVAVLTLGWNPTRAALRSVPSSRTRTLPCLIVEQPERRHRPWRQAEVRREPLGGREAEPALPEAGGDRPDVDRGRMSRHHEVVAVPLLVPEKEVLAVHRVDAGPVLEGFFDGEHRRMLVALERDAERLEARVDRGFFRCHGSIPTWRPGRIPVAAARNTHDLHDFRGLGIE